MGLLLMRSDRCYCVAHREATVEDAFKADSAQTGEDIPAPYYRARPLNTARRRIDPILNCSPHGSQNCQAY
jgi:hypothetical protein